MTPGEYSSKTEYYDNSDGHQNDFSPDLPLISNLGTFDQPCQLLCVINSVDTQN